MKVPIDMTVLREVKNCYSHFCLPSVNYLCDIIGDQRVFCLSVYIYRWSGFLAPGDPRATRKRNAGSVATRFKGHPYLAMCRLVGLCVSF